MRLPRPLLAGLLGFALSLPPTLLFFWSSPVLQDTDSYYHLAVGREIARLGALPQKLEWARFSLLHEPFPDKELLFHWLLVLASDRDDPFSTTRGRIALALFVSTILGTLAGLGFELAGRWGFTGALLLPLLALDVTDRLVRLRPELLALLLLLWAVRAAAAGWDRTVGVLGFLFALSYTAFHAFLGLFFLYAALEAWIRRELRFKLLLYTTLGVGLGLLGHPAFPANLTLWAAANVHLFRYVEVLGAGGAELQPATTRAVLQKNLGLFWCLGVLVAHWYTRKLPVAKPRLAEAYAVAAAVFGLLYLWMWRFGLYALPFLSLTVLAVVGREGWISPRRASRIGLALAWGVALWLSLPTAFAMGRDLLELGRPPIQREAAWRQFGKEVPEGARIAAPWGIAQAYTFFAPQGRYLNLLDPVLMALPFPELSRLERSAFSGEEPDLPLAVHVGLQSDYLAFSAYSSPLLLQERAAHDPRLVRHGRGPDLLYRVEPGGAAAFLRSGWRAAPRGQAEFRPYPRLPPGQGGELEAYLDALRIGRGCVRFEQDQPLPAAGALRLEFAPYGPGALWLGDRLLVATGTGLAAVLGKGLRVELEALRSPLAVEVCPDRKTGRNGFYLRFEPIGGLAPPTETAEP